MRKYSIFTLFFFAATTLIFCQQPKLQTARHGLDLIHGSNVTKEEIIDDVRFADGKDEKVDIIRFDNVGTSIGGNGPLIVSVKEPILVDSLGLIPLKLEVDYFKVLVNAVDSSNTGFHKRLRTEYLFRVTYRSLGKIEQYYIGEAKSSSDFFKKIEQKLIKIGDKEALGKFYSFLYSSRLLNWPPRGDNRWKY